MHRGLLDIKYIRETLKLSMLTKNESTIISEDWALKIMRKVFRAVYQGHKARVVHSLPTVMSDEDNISDKTCSRLITYDVRYLVAQNDNIDL